jgi:hypothetical protein
VSAKRRGFAGLAALAAALILLALILTGGGSTPTAEEPLWSRIAAGSVTPVITYDVLVTEPPVLRTPESVRRGWTSEESASWATGFRTCQRPWQALVALAGLSEWIRGAQPESTGQLQWLARKLLYLEKMPPLAEGTLKHPFAEDGCIDGFRSLTKAPAARGGVDARP